MATTTALGADRGVDDVARARAGRALGAVSPLAIGGVASLGAGAIHAVAVGSHSEHPQAARAFIVVAALQVAWGAVALVARSRAVALAGLVVGGGAVGGWVLAKTTGIDLIDGLDQVESIQRADALAAALAAVAVVVSLRSLVAGRAARDVGRSVFGVGVVALAAVSLLGMDAAGSHAHAGGGPGHEGSEVAGDDHAHGGAADDEPGLAADDHAHGGSATVAPVPYDPEAPIDLGGVPGVTPEEQARAENLVAITLARLPKFADPADAEAVGFRSIRDGGTGHEHFINWDYVDDGQLLNPDVPESLVYEVGPSGERTLVSAMFMMPTGSTLDEVPELGGDLTQWHVHDDLCLSDDPVAPFVAGITSVGGDCAPPTRKLDPTPMIHVWITPHPCGPFASLEGIAAGQVAPGETRLCDHAHGS